MKVLEIEKRIKEFFIEKGFNPDLQEDLFEAGIIDSMGIIELIVFFEELLKVRISPVQMTAKNFRTINSIVDLINKNSE